MRTSVRPKNTIMFPNDWAIKSFLLRLKRNAGWEYVASSDDSHVKVKPKGAAEYILIALNKTRQGGYINVDLNAEKLGDAEKAWNEIFDAARLYRS